LRITLKKLNGNLMLSENQFSEPKSKICITLITEKCQDMSDLVMVLSQELIHGQKLEQRKLLKRKLSYRRKQRLLKKLPKPRKNSKNLSKMFNSILNLVSPRELKWFQEKSLTLMVMVLKTTEQSVEHG